MNRLMKGNVKIEGKKLTVVTLHYCFLTTGNKASS